MATPAQFYDQNGELRLDGSLVGGGGSQPAVEVIGPFPVAYNTPGLTNSYVLLHTFDAPTLLLGAYFVVTTQWAGSETIALEITVNPDTSNAALWGYGDLRPYVPLGAAGSLPPIAFPGVLAYMDAGYKLACDSFGVTGMTAGAADVYALVWTL